METKDLVQVRVKEYYWQDDINFATADLKILAELFSVELSSQVVAAALGMHGAGGHGAQCGLVEGTLMFLGIMGRREGVSDENIVASRKEYANRFESHFRFLLCRELRPEGFNPDNPPHLCEALTCEAILFNIGFITDFISRYKHLA